MTKTRTCAIIIPVGPGHEGLFEEALASLETAVEVNQGLFSEIIFLRIDDPEGQLGRSKARNNGVMKAAELGIQWLFFLDADDLIAPRSFEFVAPYLKDYDAIWGSIWTIEQGETNPRERLFQVPFLTDIKDVLMNDPVVTLQMGHFVKTSVAVAIPFNESLNTGEDFDYYLRVWEKYRCIKIPLPLFFNRRGLHSTGPLSADGREWRQSVTEIMNAHRYKNYVKDFRATPPKKTISLLCPTRGRPELALRFIRSVIATAAFPGRVEILLYVDTDDKSIEQYRELLNAGTCHELSCLLRFEALWGEPIGVSKSWNMLARHCRGDILFLSNDDQVYADKGWDVVIDMETAKFPDEVYCMWFNDGINGPNFCAFPIVSRKWYETLGYFTPDMFEYFYVDTWIMDVAKRAGRLHYIPYILVEHMHFTQAKSAYDETYARNRPQGRTHLDWALFENTAQERQAEASKLLAVIDNFKKGSLLSSSIDSGKISQDDG